MRIHGHSHWVIVSFYAYHCIWWTGSSAHVLVFSTQHADLMARCALHSTCTNSLPLNSIVRWSWTTVVLSLSKVNSLSPRLLLVFLGMGFIEQIFHLHKNENRPVFDLFGWRYHPNEWVYVGAAVCAALRKKADRLAQQRCNSWIPSL